MKPNKDAQWIKEWEEELQQISQIEWKDLTLEELRVNMTRVPKWKAPVPDRLPNFWIKQFKSLHKPMAEAYSEVKDPKQTPDWLVEEATNLLVKKEETWISNNYRPVACLPTTFKILDIGHHR